MIDDDCEIKETRMASTKLKATLDVEFSCQQHPTDPQSTMTPDDIKESLLETGVRKNGYAVCSRKNPYKYTADMYVTGIEFIQIETCPCCGQETPKTKEV